ncbi:MAG: patatin-like phospholipase family protein [Erythrobacter sp.]
MKRQLGLIALALTCLSGCTDPSDFLSSRPLEFSCASYGDYRKIDESFLFPELRQYAFPPSQSSSRQTALEARLQRRTSALPESLKTSLQVQIANLGSDNQAMEPKPLRVLLLSGGGQWGAFGAGFLAELDSSDEAIEWDLVTGISTGAMQAMFVGAGDYEGLREVYDIDTQSVYASKNGLVGLVRGGSQYDTRELRKAVMERLLGTSGDIGLLASIKEGDGPSIRIGMVEARTGDFYRVDLTKLIKENYSTVEADKLADCVAGIVMASSGVPAQLSPVQIDGITFSDGGVRESVFVADLALDVELTYFLSTLAEESRQRGDGTELQTNGADATKLPPPLFYVLRNGPTALPDDDPSGRIDDDPDLWQTAMRGYATLVNQNELASITSVLLEYPRRPIKFVSADGYNWVRYWQGDTQGERGEALNCENLKRPTDQYFSPAFMQCLLLWGERHRSNTSQPSGWTDIANPNFCRHDRARRDDFGPVCDAEFAAELRGNEAEISDRLLHQFSKQIEE